MHPQSTHSRTPTLFLRVAFLAVLALFAVGLQQAGGQTFSSLHSFIGPENGNDLRAAVIQGRDGALYGTTNAGGEYDHGTVFKVNIDGTGFQTLHTFNDSDGAAPVASLIQGSDGALYGTTSYGGTANDGTVFKINTDGTGFATLYSFSYSSGNGTNPLAAVIQGKDGALYGTTSYGGGSSDGTVFKINTDGTGFATLYSFSGGYRSGSQAALLQGSDGALYGTTFSNGASDDGIVYKVNTDGTGFATLHTFSGSDGYNSQAALIQGGDGALYGTTQQGGANNAGAVFKVNTDGTGFAVVYSFSLYGSGGSHPSCGVIQGADGALYGTNGDSGAADVGTVFKVNTDGTGFQTLYSFSGSDGSMPIGNVIQGKNGSLYGTTDLGGTVNAGTVFKVNTNGTGFATLHSFDFNGSDGNTPFGNVIQGQDGALYGTTGDGGTYNDGIVFKVNTDGTGFTTLYTFSGSDGAYPDAAVIQGRDGVLYGTTYGGGASGEGTVFKINTSGTGFATLYTFSGSDGAYPYAAVIQGRDGVLYGTTGSGGAYSEGTVFKVNTDGTGFTTLYAFSGSDGAYPYAAVIQGRDGSLYGVTDSGGTANAGTVFKIDTNGTGFTTIYSFSGSFGIFAAEPDALIQGQDGALYGTTSDGGNDGIGSVFKINTDGTGFATLYNFGFNNGSYPEAVIQGSDGALYGTTGSGGASGDGTVFKINTDGTGFATLHTFSGSDGNQPAAGVIQGSDGALYGSTYGGGEYGLGTVFALTLFTDVTNEVEVSSSELIYNRVTRRYTGTLTIKNNNRNPIAGPIQAVLSHLPAGVTLVNANGTYNGAPYVTANITSLPPRGIIRLPLQFSVTSSSQRIGYTIKILSGTP